MTKLPLAITFAVFALFGCAQTSIETPIGVYKSTKDAMLDELHIEITETAAGDKQTTVIVNGANGNASKVIEAQSAIVGAAIQAAVKAAAESASPIP